MADVSDPKIAEGKVGERGPMLMRSVRRCAERQDRDELVSAPVNAGPDIRLLVSYENDKSNKLELTATGMCVPRPTH